MLICYRNYDNERGILCILDTKTMKFRLMKTIDVARLVSQGHIVGGITLDGNRVGIAKSVVSEDLEDRRYRGIPIEDSLDIDYIDGELQIMFGDMEYINLSISPDDIEKMDLFRVLWVTYIDCSCESCLLVYVGIEKRLIQYTVRYAGGKWVVCDSLEVNTGK